MICYLREGKYPNHINKDQKRSLRAKAKKFALINDLLYIKMDGKTLRYILFPAEKEIAEIELKNLHLPGHLGMKKLWLAVNERFHGIPQEFVHEYVRSCKACLCNEPLKKRDKMVFIQAKEPFERLIIDLVDVRSFSESNDGYNWMLTIVDCFSKFAFVEKLHAKSADEVLLSLKRLFLREGYPKILHSDNGKEFKNSKMAEFAESKEIQLIRGRARYPQSQGQVERFNQTICRRLSKCLFESKTKRWIDVVDECVFQYNNTVHRATNKKPFVVLRHRNGTNCSVNIEEQENVLDLDSSSEESYIELETIFNRQSLPYDPEEVEHDRQRYLAGIEKQASVHQRNTQLIIGDIVKLAKEFDNNVATRKRKLEGFFDERHFIIEDFINSTLVCIKDIATEDRLNVSTNRLKKQYLF